MPSRPVLARIALAAVAVLAVSACSGNTPTETTAAPGTPAVSTTAPAETAPAEETTPAEATTPAEETTPAEQPAAGDPKSVILTGKVGAFELKLAPTGDIPAPEGIEPKECIVAPPSGTATAVGMDGASGKTVGVAVAAGSDYYGTIENYVNNCPKATIKTEGVEGQVATSKIDAPGATGADKMVAAKQTTSSKVKANDQTIESNINLVQIAGEVGGYSIVASAMAMDGSEPDVAAAVEIFNAQVAKIKG